MSNGSTSSSTPEAQIMAHTAPVQEFHPEDDGRHRLVCGLATTAWAGYRDFTYLNGYVGFTSYYLPREGVLSAEEFCRELGVRDLR